MGFSNSRNTSLPNRALAPAAPPAMNDDVVVNCNWSYSGLCSMYGNNKARQFEPLAGQVSRRLYDPSGNDRNESW